MLHLDPDTYPCPDHGGELRPLVERALAPKSESRTAYGGGRKKPFTIFVSCPGGGEPHPQVCAGRYWR